MAATDCKSCEVDGLYSLVDIQKLCTNANLKLSEEASDEIIFTVLKTLGPKLASKAIHKLIDNGHLTKESNEYEVERILDKTFCRDRGCDVYLVKWKHWGDNFNTWEPLSNLVGCEEAIARYTDIVEGKSSAEISPLKRPHDDLNTLLSSESEDESGDEREKQLKTVYYKLKNSASTFNPVSLVMLSGIADDMREKKKTKIFKPSLPKLTPAWATKKYTKTYKEHKKSLKETLKSWETKFNAVNSKCKPVTVENDVDLEAPPENFQFICDYLPMPGLHIDNEAVMGCSCEKCCASSKHCCPHNSEAIFAYTPGKKVRLMPGSAIYECNSKCKCDVTCRNRVVQLGSQVKLAIFKTKNGCGWGVKSKQRIAKGTFVMEYLGEIITNEEAEKRGEIYDSELFTYLFDLDFDGDDCQFTIDARNYGNISHFVNHSCDPNMSVYGVWIDSLDVRLPRIALFANRDIAKGEEVCFDYKMTGDTSEDPNNLSGVGERTPAKMSPFKDSPYRSPKFRRPTISPAFCPRASSGSKVTSSTPARQVDTDARVAATADNSVVEVKPPSVAAKVSLFDGDSTEDMTDIDKKNGISRGVVKSALARDLLSDLESEIDVDGDVKSIDGVFADETTSIKAKQLDNGPTLESDIPMTELNESSPLSDISQAEKVPDVTSITAESVPEIPSLITLPKSATKQKFSCKNYRIVCHCGAKNCRKFLF